LDFTGKNIYSMGKQNEVKVKVKAKIKPRKNHSKAIYLRKYNIFLLVEPISIFHSQ